MGCDQSVPVEPKSYTVQKPGAGNKKNVMYGKAGYDHKRSSNRNDQTSNSDSTPSMFNQWMLAGAFNDTTTMNHTSTHCVNSAAGGDGGGGGGCDGGGGGGGGCGGGGCGGGGGD